MTAAAFVLGNLALLLALAATAGIAGALVLRRMPALVGGELWALAPALGLALLGQLCGLLGLAGQLHRPAILAGVAAIHLAGHRLWRELFAALRGRSRPLFHRRWTVRAAAIAGGALLAAPWLVQALYPPAAFDETLYHLPFARAFAATGGLPFLPELRFPVFPQLAEALSAALLLVGGDVATHFVALLAVVLTAALVAAWGAARFGAPAGALAAALWLGHPIVAYLGATGYVEPLLALFVTAACWSVTRWRASGEHGALALAALFAASAADVKYLGLFFLAAVGAAVLHSPSRQAAGGERWRGAALFGGVTALVLLPWYGRILALTGNPLFPFLPGLFGGSPWHAEVSAMPGSLAHAARPSWGSAAGLYLRRLVELPWDVVWRRDRVGHLPPLSPLALVTAPLLVLAALREPRIRPLAALGAGFCLLFPLLPADARYLVPVLPLFALAIAAGLADLLPAQLRRGAGLALLTLAVFSPGWLYAGYRLTRLGPLPTTPAARAAHLRQQLPVYAAVERLNDEWRPGERSYLLFAEEMRYHLRGDVVGDWFGPDNYREITPLLADPAALARRLQALGIDYFLVGTNRGPLPPRDSGAWRSAFRLLHEDTAAALYAVRRSAP